MDRFATPMALRLKVFAARCSKRIDVDLVFRAVNGGGHELRRELQPVRPPGQQWLIGHPDHGRLELIRDLRRVAPRRRAHPRGCNPSRRPGLSSPIVPPTASCKIRAERDHPRNCRSSARGQHAYRITGPNLASRNQPGEAAEIQVRAIDPLHRHAKRPPLRGRDCRFQRSRGARSATGLHTTDVWLDTAVMLSPTRLEIGIGNKAADCRCCRRRRDSRRRSRRIWPARSSTRSILLTASTMLLDPERCVR